MLRCLSNIFWLKAFVLFTVCGVIGYLLGAKPVTLPVPAVPTPQRSKTVLEFHGFDKDGNPVSAKDQHKTLLDPSLKYQISKYPGEKEKLEFTPDDKNYQVWTRTVIWPMHKEYMDLLDQQEKQLKDEGNKNIKLWHDKFENYRRDASAKDKYTFEYPVIFDRKPQ